MTHSQCTFVSVQGTYNKIELALFNSDKCIDIFLRFDVKASSYLIPLLDELLQKNNLKIIDLSFVAVDRGPGAFTSLRVTLATVNGLAFARQIKMIGISSLDALNYQIEASFPKSQRQCATLICLLNAYNNDVYYSISQQDSRISLVGCKNIDLLLEDLPTKAAENKTFLIAGNGAEAHRDRIIKKLANRIQFIDPFIGVCSAESVGVLAYEKWLAGQNIVEQVQPNYLKTQLFAVK